MFRRIRVAFVALAGSLAAVAAAGTAPKGGLPSGCSPDAVSAAYWSVWNAAEQRRIDEDIERNRKATGEFRLPVAPGTTVEVEQISHEFRFGDHIFNFDQLESDEANAVYKASYGHGGLFNQATVPFYWSAYEPVPGRRRAFGDYEDTASFWSSLGRDAAARHRFWRRPSPGPVIDFLKSKEVRVHGHVLVWGSAKPLWIYDWYCPEEERLVFDGMGIPRHADCLASGTEDGFVSAWKKAWLGAYGAMDEKSLAERTPSFTKAMRSLFRRRVADVASDYGAVVDSWDVVNESSIDTARYGRSDTGLPVWFSVYGLMPGDYPLHALRDAGEFLPQRAKLCINDFNVCEDYLAQVEGLLGLGARIDVVGCQMHLFNTNDCRRLAEGATDVKWVGTPSAIQEKLDLMAKAGRPIHISEITICAPGDDLRSRQIQAILARNMYRKWFSHPSVRGITWWNTVDGGGVRGEPEVSGLFTRDMKRKPAYEALDELINREWRTRLTAVTDGEGGALASSVSFRGFRGKYRISWHCRVCGSSHSRDVVLTGDSAKACAAPLAATECDIGERVVSFEVDGKPVRLSDGVRLLNLAKIYPESVVLGVEGERWSEVRFAFESEARGTVSLAYCNDWFGELFLNSRPVARSLHGPYPNWTTIRLDVREGRNEVLFRTRCGSAGNWLCGFRLIR